MKIKAVVAATAASLLTAGAALALVQPLKINFQGKLINPATNDPQAGPVTLTFNIYDAPAGGTSLYTETQSNVPLVNGVFSVQIGTNTGLSRELFLGASAYLGVTVSGDPGGEMTPRQQLIMSPYAFTANQLSDDAAVRLIAGPTYSTFTSAGNLIVPSGVQASSGAFANGITASSGTFTATGAAQYSVVSSSGINMLHGILDVTGSAGIRADDTGIILSTIDFTGTTTDPANGNAGYMYYNASTGSIKVLDGSGQWNYVFGQSLGDLMFSTTNNTAATAAKPAAASVLVVPFYLSHPMMVRQLRLRVTTALGAAGDAGVYTSTGGLVLHGGSSTLTTTAGAKTITLAGPTFLAPGAYFAAATWNSTTGVLGGDTLGVAGLMNGVGSVTGGGLTLPASFAPSGITAGTVFFFLELNP